MPCNFHEVTIVKGMVGGRADNSLAQVDDRECALRTYMKNICGYLK